MTTTPSSQRQQHIDQQLGKILETLADVHERGIRMEIELTNVSNTTKKLEAAIYGNGQPGLKTITASNLARIENLELTVKDLSTVDTRLKSVEEILKKADEDRAHRDDETRHERATVRQENRKFWYGLFTAIILVILDVILHIFNVI